jgi:heterodisulfide reductase subunit B
MKEYAYYPGCSLEKIAQSYHLSTNETAKKVGVELKELEDWNCCGATTYFHVDELLAYALCARNLAMAEQQNLDLVAPCSACYKNSFFTNKYLKEDPDLAEHINYALEEDNLQFSGNVDVKHLMEVFIEDVGVEEINQQVSKPLDDLKVAPYYGCQILRPRKDDEEVEEAEFFEDLLSAIGATPVPYALKLYCCGGSLILTSRQAALSMVRNLLQNAIDSGADVIATACPMCQVNLECYQAQVNQEFKTDYSLPVVYFTQLMGIAFGIPNKRIGIGKELVSATPLSSYAK